MTPDEAIKAIYVGKLVECSKNEYPEIRTAIQNKAGEWIDTNQHVRAQIALQEVKRLDDLFKNK